MADTPADNVIPWPGATDTADPAGEFVFNGQLLVEALPEHSAAPSERPTLTGADNDLAAARAFLAEYDASPHTRRRYETELTRLFYWAASQRKTVSALKRSDYDAYETFLRDPQPAALWCGPKRPRASREWRPFVGGLSDTSLRNALAIVQSMLSFWVQDGYLAGNPLALKRLKATAAHADTQTTTHDAVTFERFFDAELRRALEDALQPVPRETRRGAAKRLRLSWLYHLLSTSGCRIGELERATHSAFVERDEGWWLEVLGKGRKRRAVPVPWRLMEELTAFRTFHGLPPYPVKDDPVPLLPPLYVVDGKGRLRQGVAARQVHALLKDFFGRVAVDFEGASPMRAQRLREASAHWFRHTFVTRLVEADTPIKSILESTGHADERTLRKYNQRLLKDRHRDVATVFDAPDERTTSEDAPTAPKRPSQLDML